MIEPGPQADPAAGVNTLRVVADLSAGTLRVLPSAEELNAATRAAQRARVASGVRVLPDGRGTAPYLD